MVDIKSRVMGAPKTIKLYLDNSYIKVCESRVLDVIEDRGLRAYIVLDKSIFHPRGGGQPSDVGLITYETSAFKVRKVLDVNGVLVHYGKFTAEPFSSGCSVKCAIDWNYRYKVMKLHTAGHIIDYALKEVYGRVVDTLDAMHGPPKAYIAYEAEAPSEDQLRKIEAIANKIAKEGRVIRIVYVRKNELSRVAFNAPNISRLPESDYYRIVVIEGVNGIPCTGTHLKNTREIHSIKILGVEEVDEGFKLYYDAT